MGYVCNFGLYVDGYIFEDEIDYKNDVGVCDFDRWDVESKNIVDFYDGVGNGK